MRHNRLGVPAIIAVVLLARCLAADETVPAEPQAAQQEYAARFLAISEACSTARMELSVWCADRGLMVEAQTEMGLAVDLQPPMDRLLEAWRLVCARVIPRSASVNVTIDDGTRLRATALIGPMMLRTEGRAVLVLPETIRGVARAPDREPGTFRVSLTDNRVLEGVPLDWRLPVQNDLGDFDLTSDILAGLTVESMGALSPESVLGVFAKSSPSARRARQYCCFELLAGRRDLYAVYAAADFLGREGGEWSDMAQRAREYASRFIRSSRFRYPVLRRTRPAPRHCFTLDDGTSVTGELLGKSPTLLIVEELTPEGLERRILPQDRVRNTEVVDVSSDVANRAVWWRVSGDFAKAVRTSDHVAVLNAWGRLSHEFGGDPWAVDLETTLKKQDHPSSLETILGKAVAWAAEACPLCAGCKVTPCPACTGKGKVRVEITCPLCQGHGPHPCERCGGDGWLRCGQCHGKGQMGFTMIGLWKIPVVCGECCGRGKLPCMRCTHGEVLCPRCGRKGKVMTDKLCGACQGTGGRTCARCEGSGKWAPAKPLPETTVATARPDTLPEEILNPLRAEYTERRRDVDRTQMDEMLSLADWCIGNDLSAEAATLLQSAGRVDPGSHALFVTAVDLVQKSRWKRCSAVITLDDGNVLAGTCLMVPLIVRSAEGLEIVPFRDVRTYSVLDAGPEMPKVRVETQKGKVEGLLFAFPIVLHNALGDLVLQWNKVASYRVTAEVPDPEPATPAPSSPTPADEAPCE